MAVVVNITHDVSGLAEYTSTSGADFVLGTGLAGTRNGLNILINDTVADYGRKNAADASGTTRGRFYFDPNTLTMGDYETVVMCQIANSTGAIVAQVRLQYHLGFLVYMRAIDDAAGNHDSASYAITDAQHYAEFLITKSSGANDGVMTLLIDGVQKYNLATLDNDTRFDQFNYVLFGEVAGASAGTSGTLWLDELVINNDGGAIGPRTSTSDLGAKAFGYQFPTMGETGISWTTFSDGAGGAITVSGDADWGKGELDIGEEMRSAVYDLGDIGTRTITLTPNRYGTGSGTATLQYRTDTSSFTQDSNVIGWTTYTVPFALSCRYIQVREIKSS